MQITRVNKSKCPTCNQTVEVEEKGIKFLGIEIYFPFGKTIIKAK